MFSTSISGLFTPKIHQIINHIENITTRNQELTNLFTTIGRIQYLILALICSAFVFFGREFIYYWAGANYSAAYLVALMLMIPVTIPLIQNLGIEIQRAENKHQFRSVVCAGMAIINLILSIFLAQKYGAIGAAFGTAVSLVIANGFIINIYYQKCCGLNIVSFWQNIFQMSNGLAIPVICGLIIRHYINFYSPKKLICGILIYCIIYGISMWMFGMNQIERNFVSSPAKNYGAS